jgi:hypothetical protein
MRRRTRLVVLALSLAAGTGIPGCVSLFGSDAAKFYLLTPYSERPLESGGERRIVGVGPIEVPGYLDRPQIVTRVGANELRLAEFHKWAEPLEAGIARVIAANLTASLPLEVVFFPWGRAARVDRQVSVQIRRFDTDADGNATLDARWKLFGRDDSKELQSRSVRIEVASPAPGYADRAAAMSRALGDLCRSIVEALGESGGGDGS